MVERYFAFRHSLDIVVLTVGAVSVLVCLCILLHEAKKNRR